MGNRKKQVKKDIDYYISHLRRYNELMEENEVDREIILYITNLNKLETKNFSNLNEKQLQKLKQEHEEDYINLYLKKIKQNTTAFDLLDKDAFKQYVDIITNATIDLQLQELKKMGYNVFINTDFSKIKLSKDFILYIDFNDLLAVQKELKDTQDLNIEITDTVIHDLLYKYHYKATEKRIKKQVEERNAYYTARHKRYLAIEEKAKEITDKINKALENVKGEVDTQPTNFKPVIPNKYYVLNNPITNLLDKISDKQVIDLTGKGHNYSVELFFKEYTPDKKVDYFDMLILARLYLLFKSNTFVTPTMIYRSMTGGKAPKTKPKGVLEAIENSIDKLRHTDITMKPSSKDNDKYFKDKGIDIELKGSLLNLIEITEKQNGQIVKGYMISGFNPYFTFSENIKQFININLKLLENNDKTLKNNIDNITLTCFLVDRIEQIKNANGKMGNKIAYNSIYKALDINDKNLSKKQYYNKTSNIRFNTTKILDDKKAKGLIKDYKEYKSNQVIKGIEIFY